MITTIIITVIITATIIKTILIVNTESVIYVNIN